MNYLLNAFSFLLDIVFGALATLFVLRLVAEASRVDFHNPVSQFIYRYTNPVLAPLRRVLPNWRRINLAAIVVAWAIMLVKRLIQFAMVGIAPNALGLMLLSLVELADFILLFYIVVIFVWSLMGLFQVDRYHPVMRLCDTLVSPLLRPVRGKLVVGMFDFGPWAVLIGLTLARMLVIDPLRDQCARLVLGL
ncbi:MULTISPECIES: YggT family protein [Dyella]|uniref:YggT family protein n=2 Tax=Dyella TaxID=231454 RepID=A0A4R0YZH0_9GAMM|nr:MULTISPECIES: YggT family protein [Dyella]TBR40202.1 YggT family protein [Dyella terrae]TCI12216.1 YggT family protein [Dyella soli]